MYKTYLSALLQSNSKSIKSGLLKKWSAVVELETSVQQILCKTICILQIKLVSSKYVKSSGFFKMCVYWGWGWGVGGGAAIT